MGVDIVCMGEILEVMAVLLGRTPPIVQPRIGMAQPGKSLLEVIQIIASNLTLFVLSKNQKQAVYDDDFRST